MGSMMHAVDILREEAKEYASEELDNLPESRDEDQGALLTSLNAEILCKRRSLPRNLLTSIPY